MFTRTDARAERAEQKGQVLAFADSTDGGSEVVVGSSPSGQW